MRPVKIKAMRERAGTGAVSIREGGFMRRALSEPNVAAGWSAAAEAGAWLRQARSGTGVGGCPDDRSVAAMSRANAMDDTRVVVPSVVRSND